MILVMNMPNGTAFRPTIPSRVRCEADRGDPSYVGEAIGISDTDHTNHRGIPFAWVEVRRDDGRRSIWPSNRLKAA